VDTCDFMFGGDNSISSRIKEEFPSVVWVKSNSDSINLVASYTFKQLPNKLVGYVYNGINMSTRRPSELNYTMH